MHYSKGIMQHGLLLHEYSQCAILHTPHFRRLVKATFILLFQSHDLVYIYSYFLLMYFLVILSTLIFIGNYDVVRPVSHYGYIVHIVFNKPMSCPVDENMLTVPSQKWASDFCAVKHSYKDNTIVQ